MGNKNEKNRGALCIVIGITGKSGSGKSEAAKVLADLGARVIDADAVSHEITDRGEVLRELATAFGSWIVDENGCFNRAAVAKLAFTDNGFLRDLTAITHKHIINEIYSRVGAVKTPRDCGFTPGATPGAVSGTAPGTASDPAVIVIDAPIPVEKGFLDISDAVWSISAPRESRLWRIMTRDGLSRKEAEARMSSQLPQSEYEKLADTIIHNDQGLPALKTSVKRSFDALLDNMTNTDRRKVKG